MAARLGLTPRRWSPVAFPLAVLVVFLVWSGWLYPLRPDTIGALGHRSPRTRSYVAHGAARRWPEPGSCMPRWLSGYKSSVWP